MTTKEFKIQINAARNIVWHVLWNDDTYRQWTSVFHEGSHAVSDWEQGSEIKFLGPNGDGMYAVIDTKDEPSKMYFKHLGEVKNKEKQPESSWAGAMEKYTLFEKDNVTELVTGIDLSEEWMEYFENTFPKALQKIKEIAESDAFKTITINAVVNAPLEKVWNFWNDPNHIMQWNNASDDWHTPKATNDLRVGGKLVATMAAKDGSHSFDFAGTYSEIIPNKKIAYAIEDGRKVKINFEQSGSQTKITEVFEPEKVFPIAMQRGGWQAILNDFKKHIENN